MANPNRHQYLDIDTWGLIQGVDIDKVNYKMSLVPGSDKLGKDWNDAAELIYIALDSYLARDLQEFSEIEIESPRNKGKARLDIIATMKGTVAPFSEFPGQKLIVDWKTTFSPVDTEAFSNKCKRSWQWREYKTLVPEAKLFLYRGLSRDYSIRSNGEVSRRSREIILRLNDTIPEETQQRSNNIYLMRNILGASQSNYPWPRNTQSCEEYSIDCPFLKDCEMNLYPPSPSLDKFPEMSYSKKELFLLCPERYRRTVIAQLDDALEKDYDNTTFGSVVHEGLAEIYRQMFGVKE